MKNREAWLTSTMIELSDTLVPDYNLAELLSNLAARFAELFKTADVSIVVVEERGALQLIAFSTERVRVLEQLELQHGDGPSIECIRRGAPIAAAPLDGAARDRWPNFHTAARERGCRQVLALPFRLRDTIVGAIAAFLDDAREIPEADMRLAKALADIATIGILHERAIRRSAVVAEQLQVALNSRIVIEQAKGMLAQRHDISFDAAFHLLRDHARNHNHRLTDVARSITSHRSGLDEFVSVENRH